MGEFIDPYLYPANDAPPLVTPWILKSPESPTCIWQ